MGAREWLKSNVMFKKPQLGMARALHAPGNILLPASAMNNTS